MSNQNILLLRRSTEAGPFGVESQFSDNLCL